MRRFEPEQLTRLLVRASEVDNVIKGVLAGSPWDELTRLVLDVLDPGAARARPWRVT